MRWKLVMLSFKKYLEELMNRALELKVFDPEFYRRRYGFSNEMGNLDLFQHFIKHSTSDQRNGSSDFDCIQYLRVNSDVNQKGISAAVHYLNIGYKENRQTFREAYPPFDKNVVSLNSSCGNYLKTVIVLHIFYEDFVEKFFTYLTSVPFNFSLYITTPNPKIVELAEKRYSELDNVVDLQIRICPNRGRNFAPMLVEFSKQIMEHDILIHLHSKKSLYTGKEQKDWANYLIKGLIQDPEVTSKIASAFFRFNEWGLCYPKAFWTIPWWAHHWLKNYSAGKKLSNLIDVEINSKFVKYPVGGMFWARTKAISQLLDFDWHYDYFPEEMGQTDGTLHHAIERILGLLAERNGYSQFSYNPYENVFHRGGDQFLDAYKTLSSGNIIHYSSQFKVISFDIFDTLIMRNGLWNEYAKWLVGDALVKAGRISNPEEYIKIRNSVELQLRAKKNFKGDVSYKEIIRSIVRYDEWKEFRDIISHEYDYDLWEMVPRTEVSKIFKELVDSGKRVIFVSDMYYSSLQIRQMLSKCGIKGEIPLYVSSECRRRKDRGDIWEVVLSSEKIQASELLHIGDNMVSDIQIPCDNGISTLYLMNAVDRVEQAGYKLGPSFPNISSYEERELFGAIVKYLGHSPFLK